MANRQNAKREDQRVRLTKTLLQNAFLELLAEKPVERVSVVELCRRAGVNRGTFYLHFKDVYDLLEQMEEALFVELDALLSANPVIVSGEGANAMFIQSIFNFFEENRAICAILLGDHGDPKFVAGIMERGKEKSVEEYRARFPGTSQQKAETFYYFIAWGFLGLLRHTMQTPDFASFETITAAIGRIVADASRFFEE